MPIDKQVFNTTDIDLTTTTLSSIEILSAGLGSDSTFTVDADDLASNGSVLGNSGNDTLTVTETAFDLRSTTLSSVERLVASDNDTVFTLNANDIFKGGSITGVAGIETIAISGATLDLTSTTVTSVEVIKAGTIAATNFIVNQNDLASDGSVIGSTGSDTLIISGTQLDLTSTTLSSVENLKAGTTNATEFIVVEDQLDAMKSIKGSTGNDTLIVNGTDIDLSSTALSSIEILEAGTTEATTFTIDTADLAKSGSITGSAQDDTLTAAGTALDLSSTAVSSVEILQAGTSKATTFTVNQDDLSSDGSVTGGSANDTLKTADTELDLTDTTVTSVEILKAGNKNATTFTVEEGQLASGGSVMGSSGNDTLLISGVTDVDLTSTTLSSVEILKATTTDATTFTVDNNDLAKAGSISGSSGSDTLKAAGSALDLSSTTLSSVENIEANSSLTSATTFTVDSGELTGSTQITGNASTDDTLAFRGTGFDISSATLSSIEILKVAAAPATTITLDETQLAAIGTIAGSSGSDTLVISGTTAVDLTSTTLTSVDNLKAGTTGATTFTVDAADLAAKGTVKGTAEIDTLSIVGTAFNLSSTVLSSIDVLQAGSTDITTFTLDNNDLASGGSIVGTSQSDILKAGSTTLDLSSTTLDSIEALEASKATATTFTVDATDLSGLQTVSGSTGKDTLLFKGTAFDLTSITLSSIEILKAGGTGTTETIFTVDADDLASAGTVTGNSSANDTLTILGAVDFNLKNTALSSVEKLVADVNVTGAVTFTLDQADLAKNGTVEGISSESDTLLAVGTVLDLSSTTLTSIEILQAGNSKATTFTVNPTDLASDGSVMGSSGTDTLKFVNSTVDLTSTTLSSIEKLQAGTAATVFTVDADDLVSGGSVLGSAKNDTLLISGATLVDLSSTTLSSVEILQGGTTGDTTFLVDTADLAKSGSITGNTGALDTLQAAGTALDLSSTALTSIDILQATSTAATTFTVDQADLASDGFVYGTDGVSDTLKAAGSALNLTSTTLSSVEVLQAGKAATTFTIDADDLASGGSILGGTASDTLIVKDAASIDLTSTTLSSVEVLKAGTTFNTTFIVDVADLAKGGSIVGSSGNDELQVQGTLVDLRSTGLSSIELISATTTDATTFVLDSNDLGGTIEGDASNDIIKASTSALDISSTTLSSIEILQAGTTLATSFTVNANNLLSITEVQGSSGKDTLKIVGANFDLSSTVLSSVEILRAGTVATTFTLDAEDLASGGSVIGYSSGNDTLAIAGSTVLDLSSTTLSSVETLKAGTTNGTSFIVDNNDLAKGGSIVGNAGENDTVKVGSSAIDLSSTTLSSIETIEAGTTAATTFTVDTADLGSDGFVNGTAKNDTLKAAGTSLDLSSTTLSSVEILSAAQAGTTFIADLADLSAGMSVLGSSGKDTLRVMDADIDLRSTSLSSIEVLQAGTTADTIFTIDTADLSKSGSVLGSSGSDTLLVAETSINLSSTTLSSVEVVQAGLTASTTFMLDQADLASGGSIIGTAQNDTLQAGSSSLNLSSTTLDSVEIIRTGATATTIVVDTEDLVSGGSVIGSTGSDTLQVNSSSLDLTSTTLTSVEIIRAGSTNNTEFRVDTADMAGGGQLIGSSGTDTLVVSNSTIDLRSSTLSSVEIIQATDGVQTIFTLDTNDLASGGSILGVGGATQDTIVAGSTALDLSSTTLDSIEFLQAASGITSGTTFTVDANELSGGLEISGNTAAADDTVAFRGSNFDLSNINLSSIEVLKSASTSGTTFTVDVNDLTSGGSVIGSTGKDTLKVVGATVDLSSTTLSSIDVLQATATDTAFWLDANDLAASGSILGSSGNDTIYSAGTSLDLSSTTLSSIESLQTFVSAATTFTIDGADLTAGIVSIYGSDGSDTLIVKGATDLSSTSVNSIETLKAGSGGTAIVLGSLGTIESILGTTGNESLEIEGATYDTTSTILSSIEILKGDSGAGGAVTFTVDLADLATGGSVTGTSHSDILTIKGTEFDLSNTSIVSVENLVADQTVASVRFTVDQADLSKVIAVSGTFGVDTLRSASTDLSLVSTTLSSVEVLAAGKSTATTFTVNADDVVSGGSVLGSSGNDTLAANFDFAQFDLTSMTLSSVEILKTTSLASTVIVDQADLASGGSVLGNSGTIQTLQAVDPTLDLRSTTLSSVEVLAAGSADTTFIVDQADLASSGSVVGSGGTADTIRAAGTSLDLSSTTLSSIEIVEGTTSATTFTITADQFNAGLTVKGSTGSDTLIMKGSVVNLTSTVLDSIETIKGSSTNGTIFAVDLADISNNESIIGNTATGTAGLDKLYVQNTTSFDLSSVSLSSIEELLAGASGDTTFTLDASDIAANGSISGNVGNDTIIAFGSSLNLSSTTVSSVEILMANGATPTTFTVNSTYLTGDIAILGGSGDDTLALGGTAKTGINVTDFDLTSVTLTSIEILRAASASATRFTVDDSDLLSGGSVIGSTGVDTLIIDGATTVDLTSTTLSSVERLTASTSTATEFIVNASDLASGGSVIGSSGSDTLFAADTNLDLSSTTLSSIERIEAYTTNGTTFTVDTKDVTSISVFGNSGDDTLAVRTTSLDLRSTTLSSIEILKASSTSSTTFTVDQADLWSGGSVIGATAGTDTISSSGGLLDLTSTTLSSIEILVSTNTSGTTFTIDADGQGLSITGGTGADTFTFTTGYKQDSLVDTNAILADTATITNFNVSLLGEVIDVSDLVANGTAAFKSQSESQGVVDALGGSATLKDAIDAVANYWNGATDSVVTSFTFGSATYVLVDNSSTGGQSTNDMVIKLTNVSATLTSGDFTL